MNNLGNWTKYYILSFIITLALGYKIIPLIRKKEIGQNVREYGPESHLSKSGTPTMGGIIIFINLLIMLVLSKLFTQKVLVLFLSTLLFGAIGFIDDYFKIANKRSLGLTALQKLIGQFLFAFLLVLYNYKTSSIGTNIIVPFSNKLLDLGILYIPFLTIVVVGTVNSVNLTDGLDGLASKVTAVVLMTFTLVALKLGYKDISLFSLILASSCMGFLVYNAFPAKIFMGDTGSMLLGGAVAGISILLNVPLLIPLVGFIYLIEALSVIIQVSSYKLRKKRVFLMSPIHHHYEEKGWHENRVVCVFTNITIILALISIVSIY